MIVDAHTHAFPDGIAARAVPLLEREGEVEAFLDGRLSSLLRSMDSSGVDIAVVASIATKPAQFESILRWSSTIASSRILPFPSVHPDDPYAARRVGEIARAGFRGVKLHPYYQGFSLTDVRMRRVYEAIQSERLTLLMHTGFDLAFPRERIADPAKTREVIDRYPGLKLIASHFGAWEDWEEFERRLLGREVYIDTSYSIASLGPERAKRFMEKHPDDYVLFGTDSPWGGQAEELAAIRDLGLSPVLERKVLGENAVKLLGVPDRAV